MHALEITEKDHITFQLYEASTNPVKIKSRRKSFFILLGLGFLVIVCGYLRGNDDFLFYYGIGCTLVILCFGNLYIKWRHKRHYIRGVKNALKDSPICDVKVDIVDDQIRVIDNVSDTSVKISEIKSVNEIRDIYFLKFTVGQGLILPKTIPELNKEIEAMIRDFNIPHNQQLDWKW